MGKSSLWLRSKEIPTWLLVPGPLCPKASPPASAWRWLSAGSHWSSPRAEREKGEETGLVPTHIHSCPHPVSLQAAQQRFTGRTAGVCASVRTAPAATTSAASAPAARALPGNTVSRVSGPEPGSRCGASASCREACPFPVHPSGPRTLCSLDFGSSSQGENLKAGPTLVFEVSSSSWGGDGEVGASKGFTGGRRSLMRETEADLV